MLDVDFLKKGISSMDQKMMTMILHVCKLYRIYPAFIVENKPPIVKLWRTQSMRADKRESAD